MSEKALTTLEDQQRLLERDRVKAERKKLVRQRRDETLKHMVSGILLNAAKIADLRRHAFKSDEELLALGLKPNEVALVRQYQEPKRNAAYAIESASRQVESHLRGQQEKGSTKINVENMTVIRLPPKSRENLPEPVVIDVDPEKK